MTIQLPEGVEMDSEMEILWEVNAEVARVIVMLGDATITVESTSERGGEQAGLLVQLLPQAFAAAVEQMNPAQEEE